MLRPRGPPRGEVIGIGEERAAGSARITLGGRPEFWEFMCTAVEVEVDRETGMVDVTRWCWPVTWARR